MLNLRSLKKIFDSLKNDRIRAHVFSVLERFNIRKDVVRIDTNDVCNIECIMCPNKPQKCTREHYMPLNDFKKIIDLLAPRTRLLYLSCTYEPLMTPSFEAYLHYARQSGIPFISFATNGLLLNEGIIMSCVDDTINEVIVSINGYNDEDYRRIMFRSKLELVKRNLKEMNDYKMSRRAKYPEIRINTILIKSNIMHFEQLEDFIEHYDISTVQFRELILDHMDYNNPGEVESERLSLMNEGELLEALEKLRRRIRSFAQRGRKILLPLTLMKEGSLLVEKPATSRKSCCVPFFSTWINHRGEMRLCRYDEAASIGNLLQENPEDIEKRRANFRKAALSGKCSMNCATNLYSSTLL